METEAPEASAPPVRVNYDGLTGEQMRAMFIELGNAPPAEASDDDMRAAVRRMEDQLLALRASVPAVPKKARAE
eukprot:8939151-Pyramimonas_sp.AAC.1